jgi:demethylmenaquinone methyltransferase/2-methoxy-6-polyprenyl-1,4-benzoquinol methylase
MFDSLAGRYDLVNRLLSLGLDRWWRRAAFQALASRSGDVVLDLGCGTGKLGRLIGQHCTVVGLDVSMEMLRIARRQDPSSLLVQGSAFRLPFRSTAFTGAASAFLLRNLDDLPAAFGELARVVAPEGRIALLDITEPPNPRVRRLFEAYFVRAAPALGALAGNAEAYRYLVRSLAQLPPREALRDHLQRAGFHRAVARPLTAGVVTLFTAERR